MLGIVMSFFRLRVASSNIQKDTLWYLSMNAEESGQRDDKVV